MIFITQHYTFDSKLYMTRFILLFLICTSVIACSKNSDNGNVDYSGTYKGSTIDSINGQLNSTTNNVSITLMRISGSNNYTIINGFTITSIATISGSTFSIPEVTAAQTSSFKVIESANGYFSGPNNTVLNVTFYQKQLDPITNGLIARGSRKCIFTKL